MDEAGVFHKLSSFDDGRISEVFSREVLRFLVGKELLSPEWAERLLTWRHTGFSVHSRVRAKTKPEAERVGKYMIRPLLSLERLSFLEPEGKVGYRWGRDRAGQEMMDYPEFIARVTSHIPDKGQVTVRYYGLYANAHRGKVRKAGLSPFLLRMAEEEVRRIPSKGWAEMIRKVYEVDPMVCPKCGGKMKVVAFITDYPAVDRIIDHLKLTFVAEKPPPSHVFEEVALMAAEERADYF
ncbi:MAG: transposase [Candidatus Aminicenantes bacterium]|nr:transposase [Candidatus Aminicenantes bacterium]